MKIASTFQRKPRKRDISRSFRIPPDVDKALETEAAKRRWTKTFLIRDILCNWLTYHKAWKPPEEKTDDPT